ncbi:hypothetical protein Bealeia2_01138 [Candidatus Bealeia paramacronuclearis]|uniref:hypothetical protein n=1 Tax=Candidatus Bealeia paramacronuclearis TaxID=1921001 RepID=UPI002C9026F6|nr:hypothetical protein [Candidatus Bealeia paramacronuclearis]
MAKSKFMLTEDLVKVEPESQTHSIVCDEDTKKIKGKTIEIKKERISLNIDSSLKLDLQIFCIKNKKSMSEFIEESIRISLDLHNKI